MTDVGDPDLTALDATALQAFMDNDVDRFIDDIVQMRKAGQTPPALYDLQASPHPVQLGQMSGDDNTGGASVVANAKAAAKAIDQVLNHHHEAFTDLRRELGNVITTMLKTQGESLSGIDGQKFLTAIKDYDFEMNGGSGTGSGPASAKV
ncbi:type VII secretion system-associated protein [Streptomyces sp. J2-1]|uniref:type VII secretion system-associated protein n=1 Tax=Streptomyces corallincola TaxID=2851888 RepID=UPI001C390264|nr:type VII secretion system-associated protein [Streptomyces corallincola]MBV2354907.1 type VII secretion system-associated protein [Streptomyces corallincola]